VICLGGGLVCFWAKAGDGRKGSGGGGPLVRGTGAQEATGGGSPTREGRDSLEVFGVLERGGGGTEKSITKIREGGVGERKPGADAELIFWSVWREKTRPGCHWGHLDFLGGKKWWRMGWRGE